MLGKCFKTRIGAAVMAAALAFSTLSAAMPGEVAYAEENVAFEDVTEEAEENVSFEDVTEEAEVDVAWDDVLETESVDVDATEEEAEEDTEEVTDSVSAEYQASTDSVTAEKRVRVFGKFVGATIDEPMEILFKTYNGDSVTTTSRNGEYIVDLLAYETYKIYLPGVRNYYLVDPYDEGVRIKTQGKDLNYNINIKRLNNYKLNAVFTCNYGDSEDGNDDLLKVLKNSIMVFDNEYFHKEIAIDEEYLYVDQLPVGDYTVSIKNRDTGYIYMSKPYSFYYYVVDGYIDHHEIEASYLHYFDVAYGDDRTRDSKARIVCNFFGAEPLEISHLNFIFEDRNDNTFGPFTYYELRCGLVRLPINRTYTLWISGINDSGYDIQQRIFDSRIQPLKEHCGDGYYSYDVWLEDIRDYVMVSGRLIGDMPTEPIEIEFSADYLDEHIFTTAYDGYYSVELTKNASYDIYLSNAPMYAIDYYDGEVISIETGEKDFTYDIPVYLLDEYDVNAWFKCDSDYRDDDYVEKDYLFDVLKGAVMTFKSKRCTKQEEITYDGLYVNDLVVGDYIVTIKSKDGHVYMSKPYSFTVDNPNGYLDHLEYSHPVDFSFDIDYGDYKTRNKEARIICDFAGIDEKLLKNTWFRFADSDNNYTSRYSYSELRYGLVRLPKNKTYKIVASGLPDGYEIDYTKSGKISPLAKHCGDGKYNYTVAIKKSEAKKTLKIVKDTEDIAAKNGAKCTFKIKAEGTGLKYSWYYMKPGATKFTKAGVYTNEYTRTAGKSTDGMQVYCVVTDANGKKVQGRVATLTLDKQIEITYPNGKNVSAAQGKKVNFVIKAASDLKLSYNWYYMIPKSSGGDGKFHKAGCYTSTYTRSAASKIDGMQAYCLVTDSTGTQVKSDVITFKLKK